MLTTQIGFVMRTVAEPAMAPAIMDSIVVSFFEARPALRAARSKKARVHSYPGCVSRDVERYKLWVARRATIVVDKVRHADTEQRRVKTGIKACNALTLNNSADGIIARRLCSLGFYLGSGGEGNQRISDSIHISLFSIVWKLIRMPELT